MACPLMSGKLSSSTCRPPSRVLARRNTTWATCMPRGAALGRICSKPTCGSSRRRRRASWRRSSTSGWPMRRVGGLKRTRPRLRAGINRRLIAAFPGPNTISACCWKMDAACPRMRPRPQVITGPPPSRASRPRRIITGSCGSRAVAASPRIRRRLGCGSA